MHLTSEMMPNDYGKQAIAPGNFKRSMSSAHFSKNRKLKTAKITRKKKVWNCLRVSYANI